MLRDNLVQDLCQYTSKPQKEVLALMAKADQEAADLWETLDGKGRSTFYSKHPNYIYGLTHWHTAFDYRSEWTELVLKFALSHRIKTALDFGCFPSGTQVSMADLSRRPIEDIIPGDEVIGHDGKIHTVSQIMERPYSGELIELYLEGHSDPLVATVEHPILGITAEQARCPRHPSTRRQGGASCRRDKHIHPPLEPEFIPIKKLRRGDYIVVPVPHVEETPIPFGSLITETLRKCKDVPETVDGTGDLGWFMGLFIAEGSYLKSHQRLAGLRFSMNIQEKLIIERAQEIASRLWGVEGTIVERPEKSLVELIICCKKLALVFHVLVGGCQEERYLHPSLYQTSEIFRKELLRGYLEGDGHRVNTPTERSYTAKSCSPVLIEDLSWLTVTLGVHARVRRDQDYTSYALSGSQIDTLFGGKCVVKSSPHTWREGDYIYVPIKYVSSVEVKDEPVFNLTVGGCNSYVVDRVAVHNCGIGVEGLSLAEAGIDVDLNEVGKQSRDYIRWKIGKYKLDRAILQERFKWGKTYDFVVLCDVIGHVDNPIELIQHLASHTRYLFYTEDFDIGVAAYPMHAKKPINYDRVFQAAFRLVDTYIYESRELAPKMSLVPSLKQMTNAEGGVKRVIEALTKHLPSQGITVVEPNEDCDFSHCHATALHPKIMIHGNHGFYPWNTFDSVGSSANQLLRRAVASSRKVLSVSKLAPQEFEPRLKVHAEIIPNGVDLETFDFVPEGVFAEKFGIKKPFLLWAKVTTAGVCDPTPALELARRMPEHQFVFTMTNAPSSDNVKIVGKLPYPVMLQALKDCAVLLATTKENFSVQTLEAMACGKPVLAINYGGNAEAILHKQTGYLADNVEGLIEGAEFCLKNAKRLGDAGRKRVEQLYQWKDIVPRIAQVYRETYRAYIEDQATRPLVSVIVPCYNAAETVAETLDSIYAQTMKDFEVICVDDGSTDTTLSVLKEYQSTYPALMIRTQKNARVAAARNNGIENATGRYIVCIDSDDKMAPTYLEKASSVLDADWSIGIAYPDFQTFGDSNATIKVREYNFDELKKGNYIVHAAMFRREIWERTGGYKDINPSWEDYEFWLHAGKLGFYGKRIPEPLFYYRKRKGVGRDHESQTHAPRLRRVVNSFHPDLYPPVVSVVIPCFNHANYLKDSIGSIMNQTFQDFEIIVVDDGSTEPKEVEREVAAFKDTRLKVMHHKENKGLAETRNTGVRAACGKYILTLDADDMIKPTFLSKTTLFLDIRKDVSIAYTDIELFGTTSRVHEMPEYDFDLLLKKDIMVCASLYRREVFDAVGGYDPRMNIAWEDYLFWIQAGKLGYCGARIADPLFMYRRDRQSMILQAHAVGMDKVRRQLHDIEPELFKFGRKPAMCCGKRAGSISMRMAGASSKMISHSVGPVVGESGLVELQYVGKRAMIPVRGATTGAMYEFARGESKYCDPRDASTLLDTGMFAVVGPEGVLV